MIRHERTMIILLSAAVVTMMFMMTACGSKKSSASAGVSGKTAATAATASAAAAASADATEVTDAAAADEASEDAGIMQGVEVGGEINDGDMRAELAEKEEALSVNAVPIPAKLGFAVQDVKEVKAADEGVSGDIASDILEVTYASKGGATIISRSARGTGDISGYTGQEYTDMDINGKMVKFGTFGPKYIIIWTEGDNTYAAIGEGMSQDLFTAYTGLYFAK